MWLKHLNAKQGFNSYATEQTTDLIKLNPELSSTLERGGEGVEVLTPEGKKFLDAKAAQCVISCVTYSVLLTH